MKRKSTMKFLLMFALLFSCHISYGKTYYVKKNATGTGESWNDASGNIQSMINKADVGDEVWVAEGTYYPTYEIQARVPRTRTFLLKDGVHVYGGFAGTETDISQRAKSDKDGNGTVDPWEFTHETIMSGNYNAESITWTKKDGAVGGFYYEITSSSSFSYRVVTCLAAMTNETIVDGFTIRDGYNNQEGQANYGAGIYALANTVFDNCIVKNNRIAASLSTSTRIQRGGGVYTEGTIQNSLITANSCQSYVAYGAGIFNKGKVINCTVSENSLYSGNKYYAAGIYNDNGGSIDQSTIKDNCALLMTTDGSECHGGGVYNNQGAISGSTISGSIAGTISSASYGMSPPTFKGTGLYNLSGTVSGSYISGSQQLFYSAAYVEGGGVYNNAGTIRNSFIFENVARTNTTSLPTGAGIYNHRGRIFSSHVYRNTMTIVGYEADDDVQTGGIYNHEAIVDGCRVYENSSIGIYNHVVNNVASYVVNCDVYSNAGVGIYSAPPYYQTTNKKLYITRCKVFNNSGGGVYNRGDMNHCIIYNNAGGGLYSEGIATDKRCKIQSTTIVNNSSFDYEYDRTDDWNTIIGTRNTSSHFVKPTSFTGLAKTEAQLQELFDADWRLKEGSFYINQGFMSSTPDSIKKGVDYDGNKRVALEIIDDGAYEYQMPVIMPPFIERFDASTFKDCPYFYANSLEQDPKVAMRWEIVNKKAVFRYNTSNKDLKNYSFPLYTYNIDAKNETAISFKYDMSFEAYAGMSTSTVEELSVEYSFDFLTWTAIANYKSTNGNISVQNYEHDLSAQLAGKQFYIRFRVHGEDINSIEKWEIDNVSMNVTPTFVEVTGISVLPVSKTIKENETFKIVPTILPEEATNQDVVYSGGNSYVSVDANGNVKGLAVGNATIKITSAENSAIFAECIVAVEKEPTFVTGISVSPTSKIIRIDETFSIIPTIVPSDATNQNVVYSGGNTYVSVDANGNVKGLSAGSATIKITSADNATISAECLVTVTGGTISVTEIILSETNKTIRVGESFPLIATVFPENATNKDLIYSSNSYNYFMIDFDKNVKGYAPGTATIKVQSSQNMSVFAECRVTVLAADISVESISLRDMNIEEGRKGMASATILPANATNKDVRYSIENGSDFIELLNESTGEIKGISPGIATLKAETLDGSNKSVTCTVTVTEAIERPCAGPIFVKTTTAPTIDGTMDAIWNNAPASDIVNRIGTFNGGGNVDGFSANWRGMYDNDNIYLFVEVTKPVAHPDFYELIPNPDLWWQGSDAVEFFFDADNSRRGNYDANDSQYKFVYGNDNRVLLADHGIRNTEGIRNSFSSNGRTYYLEAVFPWTTIRGNITQNLSDITDIGFEVVINVSQSATATGRIAQYGYFSDTNFYDGSDAWMNTARFGSVDLRECPNNPVDIKQPEVIDGRTIIAYENIVKIDGLLAGDVVTVYNILGSKIHTSRAAQSTEYITSLREGLYTVVIEGTRVAKKVLIVK